jgi:hypothetical protein
LTTACARIRRGIAWKVFSCVCEYFRDRSQRLLDTSCHRCEGAKSKLFKVHR